MITYDMNGYHITLVCSSHFLLSFSYWWHLFFNFCEHYIQTISVRQFRQVNIFLLVIVISIDLWIFRLQNYFKCNSDKKYFYYIFEIIFMKFFLVFGDSDKNSSEMFWNSVLIRAGKEVDPWKNPLNLPGKKPLNLKF